MPPQFLGRFQPDGFVLALVGTVAVATLLPCQGTSARIFYTLWSFAMPAAHLQRCPRSTGTYGLGWSEGSAFSSATPGSNATQPSAGPEPRPEAAASAPGLR